MEEPDPIAIFASRLNATGVEYMVTGSVASIVYGEVRQTNDIDVILALRAANIQALCEAFSQDEFYLPLREVFRVEADRELRGHFNIIHHATGFRADCYLSVRDP